MLMLAPFFSPLCARFHHTHTPHIPTDRVVKKTDGTYLDCGNVQANFVTECDVVEVWESDRKKNEYVQVSAATSSGQLP